MLMESYNGSNKKRELLILLLLILMGTSVNGIYSQMGEEERVLIVPQLVETKTWDPMVGYGAGSDTVTYNIYEGLISIERLDNGTWVFDPLLSTSWVMSEDQMEWTFQLREGVLFHDNTPFNSSAVEYWFERMKGVNRGPAWLYTSVIDRVEALDEYTVKIYLTEAIPPFDFKCIMSNVFGAYGIVSPTFVQAHATEGDPWAEEYMYDHTSGTGPYMLVDVEHGSESTWEKYLDYWGGWEGDHIDKVIFRVLGDPQVQMMQFLSEEVDLLAPERDQIQGIQEERPEAKLFVDSEYLSVLYTFMNMGKTGPLQDINVRKAISYAFDYQGVIEHVYSGYARAARGPLPHGIPHFYPEVKQYNRNLTKAQKFMANSSHPEGFSATIVASPGTWEQIAEVFQTNMEELGINVEIQSMPYSVLWDLMSDPETAPEFTIALWYPDYPTADVYLTPVFGPMETAWQNWAFYENEEVNNLLAEGRYEFDEEERAGIYQEIQEQIVEDAPCLFMLEEDRVTFLAPYVEGYDRSPIHNGVSYYDMSIEGKYETPSPNGEPDGTNGTNQMLIYLGVAVAIIGVGGYLYIQRRG
jgi:peptide/nickel transport system substrate-binding protein